MQSTRSQDRAKKPHDESGLSWLKYVLFVFIEVLIFYVGFAAFCCFIVIFCPAEGPASKLIQILAVGDDGKHILAAIGYIITGTGTAWSILILNSYIYNIYSSVLACVLSESIESANSNTTDSEKNKS